MSDQLLRIRLPLAVDWIDLLGALRSTWPAARVTGHEYEPSTMVIDLEGGQDERHDDN